MKKKNAFTLVELLAVIAVLGLILMIAVPKITSTMENSKKKTLELTAKSIARSAEEIYLENETFGIDEEITCNSVSDYSSDDFSSCIINFDEEGKASITLIGKGSYKGLNICNGTKMKATAQKEECSLNTLVAHIQNLYNDDAESNGLIKDNTVDQNIRYSGSNNVVKNYVEFGNTNELWRIIGIFEVETAEGKTEELVKIVREDSIGYIAWDVSDSTINNGYGINQWGESGEYEGADLMRLLNGNYLNKQNAESACFDLETEEMGTCNFSSTGMSSSYKSMIETVVWNTAAWDSVDTTIADFNNMNLNTVNLYNAERGTVGKTCIGGDVCNDEVARTTTWEGLVALPYPTDYGYASSETGCNTNMWTGFDGNPYSATTSCKNNNWMHYGTSVGIPYITGEGSDEITWFLSPVAVSVGAYGVSVVFGGGMADILDASFPFRVRPTLYLKSDIQIIDGDGSEGNAYKLSA